MTSRTGLGPLEVAILDAIDLLGTDEDGAHARCSHVLDVVEHRRQIGHRYAWPALVDIGVPWRVHLPLVELHGNAGTAMGDPPADAVYVETRLSPIGALALAAERGEIGPIPLGIIEGSLYRGGPAPPFDPATVVGTLLAAGSDVGPPALPTGGTVEGDIAGLLAGRGVRLTLGCTIRPEAGRLVITEIPLGAEAERIVDGIVQRSLSHERDPHGRAHRVVRRHDSPVADVRDETSSRDGIRIVIELERGTDLLVARDWLRDVWPVSIGVDCRLPEPMDRLLGEWDRGDGTGLRTLADLLTT
jgi:DNA gyrase/topoisomerase IV subunit A